MKKILAMLMSVMLVYTLSACSKTEQPDTSGNTSSSGDQSDVSNDNMETVASANSTADNDINADEDLIDPESPENDSLDETSDETASVDENPDEDAQDDSHSAETSADTDSPLSILSAVWNSYEEEEKFPVFGGDTSEENLTMDAPGQYSLEDPEVLDSSLGFPAAEIKNIDDAASLVHMMNANTFSCGVYHVTNPENMESVTSAIKDNIMNRHWLCGFPEKLIIAAIDDCIVTCFGTEDLTDMFKNKMTEIYDSAQIITESPIM